MKKISLSLFLILFLNKPVFSEILTSEAVDLYKKNKFYSTVVKAVDDLKIINIYPDHTFRGEKLVDNKDLAKANLKLIKFIESERNVSLKKLNEISEIPSYFKDKEFINIYNELNQDYSINFLSQNKKIISEDIIHLKDLIIMTNQIINLNENLSKNPYEIKDVNINQIDESIDKLLKYKIIEDKNIKRDKELNRYEFTVFLIKIAEYIKNNK